MIKRFKVLFSIILIFLCILSAGTVLADTKTRDFNSLNTKDMMFPNNILTILKSANKYSDINENDKKELCNFYNVKDDTMIKLDARGYSLSKAIDFALMQEEYKFDTDELEKLISAFGNIDAAKAELFKYAILIDKDKVPNNYIGNIKELFLKGYNIDKLFPAYIMSRATEISMDDLVLASNQDAQTDNQNIDMSIYNDKEKAIIKYIQKNYNINIAKFLNHIKKKGMALEDVNKKIYKVEEERAINHNIDTMSISTLNAATGDGEYRYDKYINTPFSISQNNNERINLVDGSLIYENNLLSLPGKNGLDLNIKLRYESNNAGIYKPGYEAYDYQYEYKYNYEYEDTTKPIYEYEVYYKAEGYAETDMAPFTSWRDTRFDISTTYEGKYSTYDEAYSAAEQYTGRENCGDDGYGTYYYREYSSSIMGYIIGYEISTGTATEIRTATDYRNISSSNTYEELHNNLGSGWSLAFSSIESDGGNKILHLSDGRAYKVNITSTIGDSNLEEYTLKDMSLELDSSNFSNGEKNSYYVLKYKNGYKEYFADDGRLLGIQDRYNNTIRFQHTIINNHPVITKITDSIGRIVNIVYETGTTERRVRIQPANVPECVLVLGQIPNYTNEFTLKKIIDQKQRETVFSYTYDSGYFNYLDKSDSSVKNIFANINTITYPTKAISKFIFEKAIANLGSSGLMEYYRIISREDIDSGNSYNKKSYLYNGNYSGYPTYTNPYSLPDTYTYQTNINGLQGTTTYTFNNKNLLISEQIKDVNASAISETSNTYDNNKLLIKKTTKLFGQSTSGSKYTAVTIENTYDPNNYGDLVEHKDELGYITSYTYEQNFHQPLSIIKRSNISETQTTEFVINPANGNIDIMIRKHLVDGQDKSIVTEYEYDNAGNKITEKITQNGQVYSEKHYEYSTQYKGAYMTSMRVKDNESINYIYTEQYEYDSNTGNKTALIDGNGNRTSYIYDELGRVISVTYQDDSGILVNYYDTNGNNYVESIEKESNILKKKKIFDGLGRLIKEQEIKNNVPITTLENHYDLLGNIDQSKDGDGNITAYEYDVLGRLTNETYIDPSNPGNTCSKTIVYDVAGDEISGYNQIKIEYNEENEPHYYYYDNDGNVIKEEILPNKTDVNIRYASTKKYNYIGKIVEDTNGSETVSYIYDDLGNLAQVTDANNGITKYEYDVFGNIVKISNITGGTQKDISNKTYDELGRLIKEEDALHNVELTTYDLAGNISTKTDKNQQKTTYVYDSKNRIKSENKGSTLITYTYTNSDDILTKSINSEVTAYDYFENGLLKKETLPDGKYIEYDYFNNGNKWKITDYYGKTTTYAYDYRRRLKTVEVDGQTTTYDYYKDGSRKSITYPGSVTEVYFYDDLNNLRDLKNIKIDTNNMETVINQYSYTYDKYGNQLTKTVNKSTTSYTYDLLNRVKTVTEPDGSKVTYDYDNMGNISKKSISKIISNNDTPIYDCIYSYDDANRLIRMDKKSFLVSVQVTPTTAYVAADQQITLFISGKMNDGTDAPDTLLNTASWSSNSEKFVFTSTQGKTITGCIPKAAWDSMAEGEVITVVASLQGKEAQVKIYKKVISSLSISPIQKKVFSGEVATFTILGKYNDGTSIEYSQLNNATWTTSNSNFLLQNTSGSTVSGSIPSTLWYNVSSNETIGITATIGGKSVTALIQKSTIYLKSITITPSNIQVERGGSGTFTVSGIMSDNTSAPLSILDTAKWSTNSSSLYILNDTGSSCTVYNTSGGISVYSVGNDVNQEQKGSNTINVILPPDGTLNNVFVSIDDLSAGAKIIDGDTTTQVIGAVSSDVLPKDNLTLSVEQSKDSSTNLKEGNSEKNPEGVNNTSLETAAPDLSSKDSVAVLDETKQANVIEPTGANTLLISAVNNEPNEDSSTDFTYDNNGNLMQQRIVKASGEVIISYVYNELNQLIQYTSKGITTSYSYDIDGLRKTKSTGNEVTTYFYDGSNVIIETINGNFSARNIWGINAIARQNDVSTQYYLYNGHADVVTMTDTNGNVVNTYDYDIYGNIKDINEAGIQNPIKYAGQYYDNESNQYYLRARYYDSGLMRFITEDTNKGDVKDPLSLNLYTYCQGNPVRYFDKDGHKKEEVNEQQEGDSISSNGTGGGTSLYSEPNYGGNPTGEASIRTKFINWLNGIFKGADEATVKEFDIIKYGDKAPGFQKHHSVMDAWATDNIPGYESRSPGSPTMVLTDAQHNATRSEFMKWKYETYGSTSMKVDWKSVSPQQIQNLSERMFDAAGIPMYARAEYYRAFHQYIYNLN